MRTFNYSAIKEQKWDSDVLGLIAAIYKEAGKQELYLKQRPENSKNSWKLPRYRAPRHRMPSRASSPRVPESGSSSRRKPRRETVTSREIAGYRDAEYHSREL